MTDADRIMRAGGIVDIGPECFALKDGSLLSWRGENYVPQKPTLRVRFHNWRVGRKSEESIREAA
jgi:hypothetical protein